MARRAASCSGSPASRAPASRRSRSSSAASSRPRATLVEYLDGDVVRTHLSKGLGFSKEDRDTNIERIGWVASRLARHGATVLVSAISPYAETRAKARAMVEEFGPFVEVHVATSVEECARRDVEGPLREGVQRRARGVHGRLRSVRGAGVARGAPRDRGARAEESAREVLDYLAGGARREREAPADALAPRRARGRGDPHHARGRRRAGAARAALLRRQGLDRAAAARRRRRSGRASSRSRSCTSTPATTSPRCSSSATAASRSSASA